MRVAVAVRIDGALQPCEELVTARVNELAPVGGRLPPGHTDRQDGRPGGDPVQPVRSVDAGDEPGHLRTVALDLRRVPRVSRRTRVGAAADDVDTGQQPTAQEGVREVDSGVEQGDRHAAPLEAGQ